MENGNDRRGFLRQAALGLTAISMGSGTVARASGIALLRNKPAVTRRVVSLWADGSGHNECAQGFRPQMELFLPDIPAGQKRPAILICRGGGYMALSNLEGEPFANMFVDAGMIASLLTYRVAPCRYPAAYADAVRAIRVMRVNAAQWNIDPERIGILGFSAGGHLASLVATCPNLYQDPEDDLVGKISARPDRLMLGYPVISLEEYAHPGSVTSLLGKTPSPELLRQLSTQEQVNNHTPPAFLLHMQDDPIVPVQNSLMFTQACIKNKIPVALHLFPRGGHGVGMAAGKAELSAWPSIMMKWLEDWQYPKK